MEQLFPSFVCVICQYENSMRYEYKLSRTTSLNPICFRCESEYAPMMGSAGSIMDRRKTRQIAALAEGLRCEAAHAEWPAHWRVLNAS